MLKDGINRIVFSNKFYNFFFRPLDKIKYPVVNSELLKEERIKNPVPVNKIPSVADIFNREWREILSDMEIDFLMDEKTFRRKLWEFTHIIYVLKKMGYLYPENSGLGIGVGREQILYYLACKIKKIVGIDLYEGSYLGGEDEADIPDCPQKYAPFLYPEDNLEILRMDARDLGFENNRFDFVFSASSIEHFGDFKDIKKSVREMYRVLKPGGACVITTELRLNRLGTNIPNTRILNLDKLLEIFIQCNFEIDKENIDTRIEDRYLFDWIKLPMEVFKSPHLILRYFRTIFTSVALFFKKPGDEVIKGDWNNESKYILLDYTGSMKVIFDKKEYKKGEKANVEVRLKNTSNFNWYTDGMSHRIAIGIKILDSEGNVVNPAFGEIVIPRNLEKSDAINFNASILMDIKPGIYKVFFDLKRELMTWFSEKGNSPFIVDIEIL